MACTTDRILATVRASFIDCIETEAYSIDYKTRIVQEQESINISDTTFEDVKSFRVSRKKDKSTGDYHYHLKIVVEK